MVLYMIGLGLGDEKDITVRGLEAVRGSAKVVLEHYTSILGVDKAKLVSGHYCIKQMLANDYHGVHCIYEASASDCCVVGS